MAETLYRRPLPDDLIAFSAPAGRALFREALAAGGMEGYFPLAEQFHTQSDPAFCGLGSLVVALNAMGIDPGRLWKGPWRWYSEELLDCCVDLDEIRGRGVTLDELACLAGCNGARAELARADDAPVERLRAAVAGAAGGDGSVVIAAYDRAALGQTGGGHFSPVAGVHPGRDLALVLDVARFKYPPHWVALDDLHAAMRPPDPATGRSRGWIVLRRRSEGGAVWTLRAGDCSWRTLLGRIERAVDVAADRDPVAGLVEAIASSAPLLALRATDDPRHAALAETLSRQLRGSDAHAAVAATGAPPALTEAAAVLLLLAGPRLAARAAAPARARLDALIDLDALPAELAAEVRHVRTQLEALSAATCR